MELTLDDGCMGIDGEDLRIDYFNCETGKVSVHGTVNGSVFYNSQLFSKKHKKKNK